MNVMSRERQKFINKLHEADELQRQEKSITEAAPRLEISEMTYFKMAKRIRRTESKSEKAVN